MYNLVYCLHLYSVYITLSVLFCQVVKLLVFMIVMVICTWKCWLIYWSCTCGVYEGPGNTSGPPLFRGLTRQPKDL